MNTFISHHDEYERLYNCTGIDLTTVGVPNVPLGLFYIAVGVVLEILYIPCVKVLWSPALRQNSCHKIMFILGVLDMCTLSVNSIVTGYLTIEGAVFCSHPRFIYVVGAIVLGLWCATCATSVTLGINRSIDMWFPDMMGKLFYGRRTYVWCCVPLIYGAWFVWGTRPVTYSSYAYAWFFDPYFGIPGFESGVVYENVYHSLHNSATAVTILSLNIFLALSVWWKCRKSQIQTQSVSVVQKQIIFQTCMICLFTFCAAFLYVYMQYFHSIPTWLIIFGQSTWIGCHGGAVVVYLGFNRTIRGEVIALFRRHVAYKQQNKLFVTTAITSSVSVVPQPQFNLLTSES